MSYQSAAFIELQFWGNGVSFCEKKGNVGDERKSLKQGVKLPYGVRLVKRRKRIITRLMRAFARCKSKAKLFVTLIVDRAQRPYTDMETEKTVFARFARLLKKAYPKCWFIYKIEWSSSTKVHFHLIGSRGSCIKRKLRGKNRKSLHSLWEKANGLMFDSSACHIREYNEKHPYYLTGPKKRKNDMRCIEELDGACLWGVINKKNITRYRHRKYKVTIAEGLRFKKIIGAYLDANSFSVYHKKCLKWTAATLNFIPRKILKQAYRQCKQEELPVTSNGRVSCNGY